MQIYDSLPLGLLGPTPDGAVRELLDESNRTKSLRFDLGIVDPKSELTNIFLKDIARLRCDKYYGLSFACSIRGPIADDAVTLLWAAGVRRVQVCALTLECEKVDIFRVNAERLHMVRLLHDAGIEPVWRILFQSSKDTASA